MSLDKNDFRRVMGYFATGVTVVTTALGDERHGMAANAICSVSLEPLLLLVCISRQSHTHPILAQSRVFAINILGEDQEELSRVFADSASPEAHRLSGVPHRIGATGAPILEDCIAYVECRVAATYPGGDHTIFLGHVQRMEIVREAPPLLFYRGAYKGLVRKGKAAAK